MAQRPIIIGGCARSGTTLLVSLLSAHPGIFALEGETQTLCRGFQPGDLGRLFRLLQNMPESCTSWCEKSPRNAKHIGEILDFLGERARFLNIIRDGRDVVTSRHPADPSRYWVHPNRWVLNVGAGRSFEHDSRVLTVRYEDLVTNFPTAMREICDFVGEPFAPAILKYPESAPLRESTAWFGPAKRPHERSIGRWQESEHKEAVKRLLRMPVATELLEHYGYLGKKWTPPPAKRWTKPSLEWQI